MPLKESVKLGEEESEEPQVEPLINLTAARPEVTAQKPTQSLMDFGCTTAITDAQTALLRVHTKLLNHTILPTQFHPMLMRTVALRNAMKNGERKPGTCGLLVIDQTGSSIPLIDIHHPLKCLIADISQSQETELAKYFKFEASASKY